MPNINIQAHLPRRGLRRNIFQPIVEEGIPPGPEDSELQLLEQPVKGGEKLYQQGGAKLYH